VAILVHCNILSMKIAVTVLLQFWSTAAVFVDSRYINRHTRRPWRCTTCHAHASSAVACGMHAAVPVPLHHACCNASSRREFNVKMQPLPLRNGWHQCARTRKRPVTDGRAAGLIM
jgi:hypothetical protein